jgi:drug/metabolite transporter (DMT)-like permease
VSARTTNRLLLLLAALLFSTGGAVIKATSLTSWQVASFRSGVAGAVLLAAFPSARRGWGVHLAPVGAAYAATLVCFVLGNKLTTAAAAIYLQSTAPLYLLLLAPWLLREPIRRADLALMGAVAVGMGLFFAGNQPALATAPDPARGNLLGALSGFCWALTVTGLRWTGRQRGAGNAATASVAMGNLIAFAVCLPMALPLGAPSRLDALAVGYLGVFQIGLAYACLTRAIRHVPAFEAATLLLLEPALSPVWAWIAHGETPGAGPLAGGAIILGATLAHTRRQSRPVSVSRAV